MYVACTILFAFVASVLLLTYLGRLALCSDGCLIHFSTCVTSFRQQLLSPDNVPWTRFLPLPCSSSSSLIWYQHEVSPLAAVNMPTLPQTTLWQPGIRDDQSESLFYRMPSLPPFPPLFILLSFPCQTTWHCTPFLLLGPALVVFSDLKLNIFQAHHLYTEGRKLFCFVFVLFYFLIQEKTIKKCICPWTRGARERANEGMSLNVFALDWEG